eukprot:363395-Chlamydomonas_euryale.AAC.3
MLRHERLLDTLAGHAVGVTPDAPKSLPLPFIPRLLHTTVAARRSPTSGPCRTCMHTLPCLSYPACSTPRLQRGEALRAAPAARACIPSPALHTPPAPHHGCSTEKPYKQLLPHVHAYPRAPSPRALHLARSHTSCHAPPISRPPNPNLKCPRNPGPNCPPNPNLKCPRNPGPNCARNPNLKCPCNLYLKCPRNRYLHMPARPQPRRRRCRRCCRRRMQARALHLLRFLLSRPERSIAVVSHGGFLYHMLSMLPPGAPAPPPGGRADPHAPGSQWRAAQPFDNCELRSVVLAGPTLPPPLPPGRDADALAGLQHHNVPPSYTVK